LAARGQLTVDSAEPTQAWIPLQLDPKEISHDGHYLYAAALRAFAARGARLGQASFSINTLTAFGHNITVNYNGDSNFQTKFLSTSQTVNKATPVVAVTATP
jgi:hypothetical protein